MCNIFIYILPLHFQPTVSECRPLMSFEGSGYERCCCVAGWVNVMHSWTRMNTSIYRYMHAIPNTCMQVPAYVCPVPWCDCHCVGASSSRKMRRAYLAMRAFSMYVCMVCAHLRWRHLSVHISNSGFILGYMDSRSLRCFFLAMRMVFFLRQIFLSFSAFIIMLERISMYVCMVSRRYACAWEWATTFLLLFKENVALGFALLFLWFSLNLIL